MDIKDGSIIDTITSFLQSEANIKVADEDVSDVLRKLDFSQTLKLVDAIKDNDADGILDILKIESRVEEAGYGTLATITPTSTTIKSQTTKDVNAQRRANNANQDAARDSSSVQRRVAGGNKQPTGQGAARSLGVDPDDVQRGQNAAQANANSDQANANSAEIERLKQLAFGRR